MKPSPNVMALTAKLMTALSDAEVAELNELATSLEQSVRLLEDGLRIRDPAAQLSAASRASAELGRYLQVSGRQYRVPSVEAPVSALGFRLRDPRGATYGGGS